MSRFTGPLRIELLSARSRHARLLEPLVWEAGEAGSGREVVVPAGFVSDGVTAPRPLWWLVPPWGHGATRAAILHDYGLARLAAHDPHPHIPTRADVDAEFQMALVACGVAPILAGIMVVGVRAWSRWRSRSAIMR